ncbi:MAG: hypothetical protein E7543_07045 [Ruminococcaceae bacterium]|nr:hypothetical protein [Oscillospiraceae bacterium]
MRDCTLNTVPFFIRVTGGIEKMKRFNNVMWGAVLVVAGVLFALNALEITNIDIFFEGWWTLLIIVPSFIGLLTTKEKTANAIGLSVGVMLLLGVRDIISFDMLWKLILPVIIILIGIKLIYAGIVGNRGTEILRRIKENGGRVKNVAAVFSGAVVNFEEEEFTGAELNAVFGSVKCDLRNAVINQDCVINGSAIFGGIDVLVPQDINVKIYSNSVFGGVEDKRTYRMKGDGPTLYINATCMFGGVDIK